MATRKNWQSETKPTSKEPTENNRVNFRGEKEFTRQEASHARSSNV
jgi:hypothetical protein